LFKVSVKTDFAEHELQISFLATVFYDPNIYVHTYIYRYIYMDRACACDRLCIAYMFLSVSLRWTLTRSFHFHIIIPHTCCFRFWSRSCAHM